MIRKTYVHSRNELKNVPECDDDLLEALDEAERIAARGKHKTVDQHKFEMFRMENLKKLAQKIINRVYNPGRSKAFLTHNPVLREIFAACFEDRIVHHLVVGMVGDYIQRRLQYDSYSCQDGKGVHLALERMRVFINKVTAGGIIEAYVIKCDLSGFFMSLDRERVFECILEWLDRQFPKKGWQYELCRYLWAAIIFDDPVAKMKMVGRKDEWKFLAKHKALIYQLPGIGIVIGNLTSQLLSNVYLDKFDRYMKLTLKFKYYGRYVDDFYILVPKKDLKRALKLFRKEIPEFLEEMGLKIHPNKWYIQPVSHGIPFLGAKVYRNRIVMGKRMKGRFYQAAQKVVAGEADPETVISYYGMTKHLKAKRVTKKVFESVGWDFKD